MLKQTLQQRLQQKLSPQQIQLMKLLEVPTIELEQRIKEELEANPALDEGKEQTDADDDFEEPEQEEVKDDELDFDLSEYMSDDDTPDYKYSVSNSSPDDESASIPLGSGKTFQEVLLTQLGWRNLTERDKMLAVHLIGNLDDDGYLRRELGAVVNDLAFSQNIIATSDELDVVLKVVQDLDPPGVGARDLQECLLIQLERFDDPSDVIVTAHEIIVKYFDEFSKKHYDKITKKMDILEEELKEAIGEIVKLNPKPGNSLKETTKSLQPVIPDFLLTVESDEIRVVLNQRNAPELKISREYKNMIKGYALEKKPEKSQKEAILFVKTKIDSAKWFIDAIKQRQHTLLINMEAIANYQKEYFLTGDESKLRPMILKDVAELSNMDVSTISRVSNSKYVQTPYGTYKLKSFFSESISRDDGEEVSTRIVKKFLEDAIDEEDKRKPFTDQKLVEMLKAEGYTLARRTVAKYREQLSIPVARLRREL
ncbi:MAG: RNA polymerase sigma-54 factor [Flavobacteriales bacterium]|jgi:RNA polymerase sigma-54 factor